MLSQNLLFITPPVASFSRQKPLKLKNKKTHVDCLENKDFFLQQT